MNPLVELQKFGQPVRKPDRKFMEMAIHEMLQSRSEHRDKRDPLVGAVLADRKGKLVGRAHRGNFSLGDHAEFTLLEKASGHVDPSGCTLYATLEPCTKRRQPKQPCVERIVAKRIGRVVIGMPDPNPEIHGRGIAFLLGQNVKVDFFDKDLREQIQETNRDFIRYYERGPILDSPGPTYDSSLAGPEVRSFHIRKGKRATPSSEEPFSGASFEEFRPIPEADPDDFSKEAIEEYLTALGQRVNIQTSYAEVWRLLTKRRFLTPAPLKKRPVPTLAGLVLFGTEPNAYLPQCQVKADCYTGTPSEGRLIENVHGRADITGPLSRVVKRIEEFFEKHVAKVPQIEGFKTNPVPEYPPKVVREAVINALVHRDYRDGRHVIFQMFRDRLVVKSPGYPLPPLTLERIQAYDVEPLRRNSRIADSAHVLKYMDERGTGIPSMPVRLRAYGLREPEFSYHLGFFAVTLYGRELSPAHLRLKTEVLAQLKVRQRELIDILQQQGSIGSEEYTRRFGISRETANQDFRKLMDLGIIERQGFGRGIHYRLRG